MKGIILAGGSGTRPGSSSKRSKKSRGPKG